MYHSILQVCITHPTNMYNSILQVRITPSYKYVSHHLISMCHFILQVCITSSYKYASLHPTSMYHSILQVCITSSYKYVSLHPTSMYHSILQGNRLILPIFYLYIVICAQLQCTVIIYTWVRQIQSLVFMFAHDSVFATCVARL